MPKSAIVAMVPDMFQVPISEPTASRMKIAPIAEATLSTAAFVMSVTALPFLNPTNPATTAERNIVTCTGPPMESPPYK